MARRLVSTATIAFGLSLVVLLLLQQPATGGTPQGTSATILCVNKTGTGGCYTVIQDAIDAGAALPGEVTINVDVGNYNEHITMAEGVSIYGQGWDSNPAIGTIIDGGHSANTFVVYFPPVVTAATVLSGVQVTGGGNYSTSSGLQGGGIRILSSPTIINTWVHTCTAQYGGGVYVHSGSPTLDNVPVWNNRAEYGGGFYLIGGGEVTVLGDWPFSIGTNDTVLGNTATVEGGGFYIYQSTLLMSGMRIWQNTAYRGGGLYITNTPDPVTVQFSDIWDNSSTGATAVGGGGIYSWNSSNLVIGLNWIRNNTAAGDGAGAAFSQSGGLFQWNQITNNSTASCGGGATVYNACPDLELQGNTFQNNTATFCGGGLHLDSGAVPLVNANAFFGNSAPQGGGIYTYQAGAVQISNNIIAQNSASSAGAGLSIVESPAHVINNTISDNTGAGGDGVYFSEAENIVIVNNIITGNSDDGVEYYDLDGTTTVFTVDYNDVWNNTYNYDNVSAGTHDESTNPQFVGAGNLTEQYHIMVSSPVSETGSVSWAPVRDIDHDLRTLDGTASMGADEIPSAYYAVQLPLVLRNY